MTIQEIINGLDRLAIPNDITEAAARALEALQDENERLKRRISALEDILPEDAEPDSI